MGRGKTDRHLRDGRALRDLLRQRAKAFGDQGMLSLQQEMNRQAEVIGHLCGSLSGSSGLNSRLSAELKELRARIASLETAPRTERGGET